jgi:hypothetical protein
MSATRPSSRRAPPGGGDPGALQPQPSAREAGPHVATVIVDLLTAERRRVTLDELTAAWREEIGEIEGLHA